AGDHRVAGEFDALPLQFLQGLVDGVLAHPGGEVEEDPRAETAAGRVHGGGADAVVGGDADDVDRVDAAGGEPVGERLLVVRDALEAAVAGRLAALAEHRLDGLQREVRVEVGAGRADHAVRRPRVDEVGLVGEVVARVEVEVAGRHDVVVVGAVLGDVPGDGGGHVRAALDGERAALAEVVLHVDDDQSLLAHEHSLYRSLLRTCPDDVDAIPGNGASSRGPRPVQGRAPPSTNSVGTAGSPRESRTAAAGSSATDRAWRSLAAASGSRPTISPFRTSGTWRTRSCGPGSGSPVVMVSARATPCPSKRRTAVLRPPRLGLPGERFATGRRGASSPGRSARAARLETSDAVGAPAPVTRAVPTP